METVEAKTGYEAGLKDYVDREKAAVDLMNSVGQLMYAKGVELVFFRNHLLDISGSEVLNRISVNTGASAAPKNAVLMCAENGSPRIRAYSATPATIDQTLRRFLPKRPKPSTSHRHATAEPVILVPARW